MTVKSLFESLLVHVMANKTNATAKHEQRVNGSNVDVLLSFLAENVGRKKNESKLEK